MTPPQKKNIVEGLSIIMSPEGYSNFRGLLCYVGEICFINYPISATRESLTTPSCKMDALIDFAPAVGFNGINT